MNAINFALRPSPFSGHWCLAKAVTRKLIYSVGTDSLTTGYRLGTA